MFCPNKISNEIVSDLRQNVVQYQKQLLHYKKMYSAECKRTKLLQREITNLRTMKNSLDLEIRQLKKKYTIREHCDIKNKKRKLKEWEHISSDRTKRRRFSTYKDMIFDTLQRIGVCHRAEIIMWISKIKVQFSWSPRHFNDKLDLNSDKCRIASEHNYTSGDIQSDDDNSEDYDDVDYSEIFDINGNWRKQHIRRLVHVLDTFRVSHQAYHEIRMVAKGHLPPICRLSHEKHKMSDVIPYIKMEKVSLFLTVLYHNQHCKLYLYSVMTVNIKFSFTFTRRMQSGEQ